MTISFSGLASGLDTASWIEALTSIRQLSVTSLQTKKSSISSEQAEINKIQSLFSNVQTALDRLTDSKFGGSADLFVQKGVDTNGSEAFTATVTSEADCKSYNIYVRQLATATVATSLGRVSNYISGNTKLSDLGVKDGSLTIWVGDNSTTVDVDRTMSIDEFNTYLTQTKHLDVDFSVDSQGYISLKSTNGKDLRVTSSVDTSNFSSRLNFDKAQDQPGGPLYFKSLNSFFAMGLDTRIVQRAEDQIYSNGNAVTTGTLTINFKDIEITNTTTLADIVNTINSDPDKAMATAVWDDATGKLQLTATMEGYSHIIIDDHGCGFAHAFGLDSALAQQTGQNAIINIDGSENIYLSGMNTTATSISEVSPEKTVKTEGTYTTATSVDLSELFRGEGSFKGSDTKLSDLRITDSGYFEINGVSIGYTSDDTIDRLISNIDHAIYEAYDHGSITKDKIVKVCYNDQTNQLEITSREEGPDMIDFNSKIGDKTSSLLGVFGFTKQVYTLESQVLDAAKTQITQGAVTELTSADRINASNSSYYNSAHSIDLNASLTSAMSSLEKSNGESLGLTGDYEVRINGYLVGFNAEETLNSVLGRMNQISGITADVINDQLVISSERAGVNLTIEDSLGDFAYKMGYLNKTVIETTEINPEAFDPDTCSISADISKSETISYNTRTSQTLTVGQNSATNASKMSELGIMDSVFSINGGNDIEITANMTITEVCNAIENANSDLYANFNGASLVLTSKTAGGNSPITINATSGNFTNVMGWTDTYSTITSSYVREDDFVNTVDRIEDEDLDIIIGGANATEALSSLTSAINNGSTVIGISNGHALRALANLVNGSGTTANNCSGLTFVLTNDISLDGISWTAIGNSSKTFSGDFNGNGYEISDLTVSGSGYMGLFGNVNGATISNTAIINSSITNSGSYSSYTGLLVARLENSSIENCYAMGTVSSSGTAGGLVGRLGYNYNISDSYFSGSVRGTNAGGIAGQSSASNNNTSGSMTITNSFALGSVTGSTVGGVLGSCNNYSNNNNSIVFDNVRAYNTTTSSGSGWWYQSTYNGGFIGQVNNGTNTYTDCTYADNTHNSRGIGSSSSNPDGLSYSTATYGSFTQNTRLDSLGFEGGGTISINGVVTKTLNATDTVSTAIEYINSLSGTTKVTATYDSGGIVLTSTVLNQPITIFDNTGNAAESLGLLAPNAINGVNYETNTTGQGIKEESGWKANASSLVCENTTDFTERITAGNFFINNHEFTLTADTTLQDLIDDINTAQIGVVATYDNGTFTISSPNYHNFTMRQGDSNFTEVYNMTHSIENVSYSTNFDAYTQVNSFDSWASMTTTRNLFNSTDMVTKGTFYVNGVEFTIDDNTTLSGLINEINNNDLAFANVELVIDQENPNDIRLKITSKLEARPEVSVARGTSNFTDIVKLTEKVVAMHETEADQTLGTVTEYYGRANLDTVLVHAPEFNSPKGMKIEEGTFTINGVNFSINDSTTLGDIISDINNNDVVGVDAYWNSQTGKLTITSRTEGDKEITFSDGSSHFLTVMRIDSPAAQTLGTNGYYHFTGGKTYTSSSNTVTSDITHIEGLTINLKSVSNSVNNRLVSDRLTVENDTTYLEASVLDFVNQYNELVTELDDVTSTSGIFHSDVGLKSLATQLKNTLMSSTSIAGCDYKMLAQLGITTAAPGAALNSNTNLLSLDLNKLHKAVTTNNAEAKKFMLGTNSDYSNGVMTRLSSLMFSTMASSGFFATRNAMYGNQLSRYDTLISSAQTRISNYRSSLETKFASMEKLITSLQNAYNKMYGTLGISGNGSITNFF